jgi:hypothetical protein
VGAALFYTTASGLLKQPDKQELTSRLEKEADEGVGRGPGGSAPPKHQHLSSYLLDTTLAAPTWMSPSQPAAPEATIEFCKSAAGAPLIHMNACPGT